MINPHLLSKFAHMHVSGIHYQQFQPTVVNVILGDWVNKLWQFASCGLIVLIWLTCGCESTITVINNMSNRKTQKNLPPPPKKKKKKNCSYDETWVLCWVTLIINLLCSAVHVPNLMTLIWIYPMDTQRNNNIIMTTKRCCDVVLTYIILTLSSRCVPAGPSGHMTQ